MIASAAQGEAAGDPSVITNTFIRQAMFFIVGLIGMIFLTRARAFDLFTKHQYDLLYWVVMATLIITRISGQTNGAYGWIRIGSLSLQPSEFAKLFIVMYGAKVLGFKSNDPEKNINNFWNYLIKACLYFGVILFWQHDLGSAAVLAGMVFIILLVPPYKEFKKYQRRLVYLLFGIIGVIVIIMLPVFNNFLSNYSDHYQIARFLAADNPFAYQYDISSLVFARYYS